MSMDLEEICFDWMDVMMCRMEASMHQNEEVISLMFCARRIKMAGRLASCRACSSCYKPSLLKSRCNRVPTSNFHKVKNTKLRDQVFRSHDAQRDHSLPRQ